MRQIMSVPGPNEAAPQPDPGSKNIDLLWGVKIPMRDGIQLNATIYKPKEHIPAPVILSLTPYISDSYHARGYYFAQHGYIFALVDCRGRGNSAGAFEPFIHEAQDGYDLVEWLADQPWCDGKVTMWGGSYGGFDQWMTLKEFPPHLRTIVPAASCCAGMDFPCFKNIFFSYDMQWHTYVSGVTGNTNLFSEQDFWISKFRELYLEHRPFRELDQVVGYSNLNFQVDMDHPVPDSYWDQVVLSNSQYDRIDIPILTITGHYDGDQVGAMEYYRRHMASASPARDKHYLIIGPWDHAGTRTPNREFGGLKFGEASLLDMNKLHTEWYDWVLKGGPKPEFLKQQVAYYVTGEEAWKYADCLEDISTQRRRYTLYSSKGKANDAFASGSLESKPSRNSPPDSYVYDPLDVRPAELEKEEIKNFLTDQRYALNLFGNGLVYHSAPLEEPLEISGFLKFIAWIAMDVPDTDFQVTIYEITLDGTTILLTADQARARYRESLRNEKLVTPGEILCYEFSDFTFISRRLARGSRLRLLIACPNSIFIQKNYNSGGVVADESGKEARTAHVTLYHDKQHPSYLEIPIVPREK